MGSPDHEVDWLRQLLQSELQNREFQRFKAEDLQLLVRKGFVDRTALEDARKEHYQDLPGEALKPLLIDSLLSTFRRAKPLPGMEAWCMLVRLHRAS